MPKTGLAAVQPITMGIYKYIGNNTQDWNAIMATAVVASIPSGNTISVSTGAVSIIEAFSICFLLKNYYVNSQMY